MKLLVYVLILLSIGCGVKSDIIPPKKSWGIFEPSEAKTSSEMQFQNLKQVPEKKIEDESEDNTDDKKSK